MIVSCVPNSIKIVVPVVCLGCLLTSFAVAQEAASGPSIQSRLIHVPFPLEGFDDERIRRQIEQAVDSAQGNTRLVVVMKFENAANATVNELNVGAGTKRTVGRGTSFERALSLARYLSGPSGTRIRTVAYLPNSIEGHACLVAMACESIAIHPQAEFGRASIDEPSVDATIRQAYQDIANRRQAFPSAVIDSILDAQAQLVRVDLVGGGGRWVLEPELEKLRLDGAAWGETKISIPGQLSSFTGQQMRGWQWVANIVSDDAQLANELQLTTPPVDASLPIGEIRPAVVQLHGLIRARSVDQLLRAIEEAQNSSRANLVFIKLDSPGGDLAESLRLSQRLAELDPQKIHTVAWVASAARADAALVALSCDDLYMAPDSVLGGPGEATIEAEQIIRLSESFDNLALKTGRSAGLFYGVACHRIQVFSFRNAVGRQEFAAREIWKQRDDANDWTQGDAISFETGLSAQRAADLMLVRAIEPSLESVAKSYDVETLPDVKQGNRVERLVQRLAEQSWLPPLLMFVGFAMFMTELSTPGLGIPGFISAVCFLLFFWIRFLSGTVEWLEVLLFLGGFASLAIEVFVLPGFGIFGLGGIVMIASGLLLASQTFILPTNNFQLNEMAWNMSQVAGAFLGVIAAIIVFRKQLENLPMFRWLALSPGGVEDTNLLAERESIVHWDHFQGKAGITTTRCNPSGKAMIGDDVVNVISNGVMIDEGQRVRVLEVRGNTVVVELME